jgi:AcrR family transcriptional regulator
LAKEMPAELAESAFDLFSRRGIKNVNLDAVSEHAGVTKGSLYWHYKSKQELLEAAALHYYRTWQQRINAEVARTEDSLERLELALRFSIRSCMLDERNRVFTTDLFALSLHNPAIRRGWAQFYDSVREFYIGLVTAAVRAGRISAPDPRRAVNLMLACFEGIKQRASFEPEILAEEDLICKELMEVLFSENQARKDRRATLAPRLVRGAQR